MEWICVFCGSNAGTSRLYTDAAGALGEAIARRGLGLVYGGGRVGLMGTVADAAIRAGGQVIGVIPKALVDRELGHTGLTELRIVHSMHERKALMADLATAIVALPGGYGTLDEFCEILTWTQLGLHRKPFGLVNVNGFYDHFLRQVDHAVREGFVVPEHRHLLLEAANPELLLDLLLRTQPPAVRRWIGPDET